MTAITPCPPHRSVVLGLAGLLIGLGAPVWADEAALPPGSLKVLAGQARAPTPLLDPGWRRIRLVAPLGLDGRLEGVSSFPIDRYGSTSGAHPVLDLQLRLGLRLDTARALTPFNIGLEYEHDVITAALTTKPDLPGEGYPTSREYTHQLRQAAARVSLGTLLHLRGGYTLSHWGLGLLANGGSATAGPGCACFADPRGGDRVLRLMLASGPLTRLGLVLAAGHDWVEEDDKLVSGDRARQVVGSLLLGARQPTRLGFYLAYRTQDGEAGESLRVTALDLYLATRQALTPHLDLAAELEGALVVGTTTSGATPEFPELDVNQLAIAARASLVARRAGLVLDLLYASGDASLEDGQQTAFVTDPNYELGLLLYRHLLAFHTARAPATAGDGHLVGRAPPGLRRFPTRGGISNTIAVFPRVFWRPLVGLELYGGLLLAFAPVALADPLSTKEQGGVPHNALLGRPGSYLGTELDAGARYRLLLGGTLLTLGLEGGVLYPGSAWVDSAGYGLDPIYGGRMLLSYRL